MNKVIGLLWVLVAAGSISAAAAAWDGPVALTGVTIIDGRGGPVLKDATIVVRDGRIEALGFRHEVALAPDVQHFSLNGHYVLPGLIDAHVHFFQSGGIYTRPDVLDMRMHRRYADEQRLVRARLPETLQRYVASGVTGVADMGGSLWNVELRAQARKASVAPDLAVAGPLITSRAPPALMEVDKPPMVEVHDAQSATAAVRAQLAQGVDFIKLWLVEDSPESVRDEAGWVHAAITAARANGVRVVVHATRLELARAAVETGAQILAHGVDDAVADAAFFDLLVERDVIYIPTLAVEEGYRRVLGHALQLNALEQRVGDPEVINGLQALPVLRAPTRDPEPGTPRDILFENLRLAHAAGVRLAVGSDAGNIGMLHGPAILREMQLMVEAGLSPATVLQAATAGGAAVLGREDIGTLAVGQRANLIVMLCERNPLSDIGELRHILRVMKDGRAFDPRTLLPPVPDSRPQPVASQTGRASARNSEMKTRREVLVGDAGIEPATPAV